MNVCKDHSNDVVERSAMARPRDHTMSRDGVGRVPEERGETTKTSAH